MVFSQIKQLIFVQIFEEKRQNTPPRWSRGGVSVFGSADHASREPRWGQISSPHCMQEVLYIRDRNAFPSFISLVYHDPIPTDGLSQIRGDDICSGYVTVDPQGLGKGLRTVKIG